MDGRPGNSEAELQACRRKRRFASEREADDAVYQARLEGRELGIYACHWCGGWHLTSKASSERSGRPSRGSRGSRYF